jgi:hypothetical protein
MRTPSPRLFSIIYSKFKHKLKVEYVIYADFEAILPSCRSDEDETKNTFEFHRHEPSGFSILLIDGNQNLVHWELYRGKDCIEVFFHVIDELCSNLCSLNKNTVPKLKMTDKEIHDNNKS